MLVSKGGFKIQKENFHHNRVRTRLATVIVHDQDQAFYFFMEGIAKSPKIKKVKDVYRHLSSDWLKQNWSKWFRLLKDARPWAYTLLCDIDQPWAQRLGEHLLAWPSFWNTRPLTQRPERGEAVSMPELPAEMADFWVAEHLSVEMRNEPIVSLPEPTHGGEGLLPLTKASSLPLREAMEASAVPDGAAEGANKRRLGEVVYERDQLAKRLRILEEVHAKELAAKDDEIQALQQRLGECAQNFTGAVEELREFQEQTMQTQMASFEASVLGVHPDLVAYAAQASQRGAGLRERVNQMLAHQREVNKRYGTLQSLRDELRKTEQMLMQVKLAIEDAIQPIAGISELQRDLEARIDELKQKLGEESKNSTLALPARLKAYIIEIPFDGNALDKYSEVRRMLESPLGKKLYGTDGCTEALNLLKQRQNQAVDALARANRVPQTMTHESVTGPLLEIVQLHNFLNRLAEVDLFVDASNVIKHCPRWAVSAAMAGRGSSAYSDFIASCQHRAKFFHSMTLVFDSDLPNTTVEKKGKLALVSAARTPDGQDAGNELVEQLANVATTEEDDGEEHLRWLVTNDIGLRMRVCNVCNAVVDVFAFANFLKN
ncbi:MAG: hypothetical protein J5654_05235 [Victivallales bacterium]|nr:hypothetical protein [Victivallales bacterium]